MRNLYKYIIVFCALLLPTSAQDGEGYGFLNIANLIPGDPPCQVKIAGSVLKNDGIESGRSTGWFMFKTGSVVLEITSGELEVASGTIEITEGLGNLVGIFLQPEKQRKANGEPKPPRIRIKSFPIYETKGFGLKFVSLCPERSRFQLGSQKIDAEPFEPIDIAKWNGGGFSITHNGKPAGSVSGSSEGGAYYVLIGTNPDGEYVTVLATADKQEVPEYMKKERTSSEKSAPANKKP